MNFAIKILHYPNVVAGSFWNNQPAPAHTEFRLHKKYDF